MCEMPSVPTKGPMISMSGSVGILPERKGTAPGAADSESSEEMPSMARRPLLISTWRPRACAWINR